MKNIRKNLVKNCKKYFEISGLKTAIIGVSGGIDSAVTLAIAVEALGAPNVNAYLLPYKLGEFSSQENFDDAREISGFFGLPAENISEILLDEYAKPYEKQFDGMAFGNTLARIRMTILFGYANTLGGLILGTCNKSEIMLGYETKFGDGACDINILGNLWKSEVYELAKEYNIPENFITKTPSAELFENHSDEEEMGFGYDEAQKILEKIEISGKKFSPQNELEEKVFAMWNASAHKRIYPPTLEK